MTITSEEMRGILKGKCVPGDLRVNEEIPDYLARKLADQAARIAELEDKLRIKQNHIKLRDTYIAELEADGCQSTPVAVPDFEKTEPAFNAGVRALIDCLEDCGDAEQGLRLALRACRAEVLRINSGSKGDD